MSWAGGDPLYKFLSGVRQIYNDFWDSLDREIAATWEAAGDRDGELHFRDCNGFERGATWTYITADQSFGTATERLISGLRRRFSNQGGRLRA